MDEVVDVDDLENACRLCLTTELTRSSIFGLPDANLPFVEKIRSCLAIQVTSDDKLPVLVCSSCIKNINHWHAYKDTCLKAQEKLQQWLNKKNPTIHDNHIDGRSDIAQSNVLPTTSRMAEASEEDPSQISECMDVFSPEVQIKTEPMDTEDEELDIDVESVNSGELLINPMAVAAGNTVNNERLVEGNSTQRFKTRRFVSKKIKRRGPHTHFRGTRLFKKRCNDCSIYLHSKHSYAQHMSRYHGIVNNLDSNDYSIPPQPAPIKQKSKLTQHADNTGPEDTEDQMNPEEVEFAKMVKTDPLTSVQKTIIGQLKTFSCYSCKQTFFDRRHTLNHIRQHMPDLRPYTCIACLTEFSDRSMYKLHCGASFECAMKIALVVPKIGHEKYFTCNMCLKAFNNRRELLTHLAMHSDKAHKQLSQPIHTPSKLNSPSATSSQLPSKRGPPAGPYVGGDLAHNHMCDLCGMIYRYRPNMVKHRDLCLTKEDRISYRCYHCSMTFLVFKKFYTHVFYEHKRREIICYICHEKFSSINDYEVHHGTHKGFPGQESGSNLQAAEQSEGNYLQDPLNSLNRPADASENTFNCALCSESFATKHELSEHRNLHLKVKIYSCVVCRSMFSSSGALEVHMKVHGFDDASKQAANTSVVEYGRGTSSLNESSLSAASDPGTGQHHCYQCGKNFSNYANLKRHERNLHMNSQKRWSCEYCNRRFKSAEAHAEHIKKEHTGQRTLQQNQFSATPQLQLPSPTGKPLLQCPKCPKTFTYQGNLIQHCQNVHNDNQIAERIIRQSAPPAPTQAPVSTPPRPRSSGYSCETCGKTFKEEQSLKTHKGWHLRTNYRLKADQNLSMDDNLLSGSGFKTAGTSPPKPAKARKSFPNPPQKQLNSTGGSLQCQVCDDRFNDVTTLRNHLWDVHCARNKPEKSITGDLQCELCTTKFDNDESLQKHMKWHKQNPIFSNNTVSKSSNEMTSGSTGIGNLIKKMFRCETCGKNYSNRKMYLRHKKLHKIVPAATMMNFQSLHKNKNRYCHTCQKYFATDASLKRHKVSSIHLNVVRSHMQTPAKKITTTAIVHQPPSEFVNMSRVKEEPSSDNSRSSSFTGHSQSHHVMKKKPVTCSVCKTIFPNMSVLYQHKQLVHKQVPLSVIHQEKPYGHSYPKKMVPVASAEGLVCCNVCGKKFPGLANLKLHFSHKHKPKPATFPCTSPGCKLIFSSNSALKNHENTHTSIIYNCQLCDRHVFSKVAMTKHMLSMHKDIYHQSGLDKSRLWTETDLTSYSVKNCQSTACPKCKVKYPNLKALKIHYLKFHDKT